MNVYLVEQASGSYDDYTNEVVAVCSTIEKAEEVKKELDKKYVKQEDLDAIMPQEIYFEWPYNEETDEFDEEYAGYTKEDRERYETLDEYFNMEYSPANIREMEITE